MSAPEPPPPPIIAARNLTVSRGGRTLFRDLSFVLEKGAALVLTGPNGAGKTSLLLVLAGVLRPESGSVGYGHGGAGREAPPLHLLLARNAVKPRLSVGENLEFWRALNGGTGLATAPALEAVGLAGLGSIEAGHLSTGQVRRLALARLLVSERPVWLLDEPTSGLDADGEALVRTMIAGHCRSGGVAVVATHHDLALGDAALSVATLPIGAGTAGFAERRR